jgi:hypothetical protein
MSLKWLPKYFFQMTVFLRRLISDSVLNETIPKSNAFATIFFLNLGDIFSHTVLHTTFFKICVDTFASDYGLNTADMAKQMQH